MTNEEIRNVVMLELISPSPDEGKRLISEEESEELYKRYKESKDWCYVFGAIKDESFKQKMIDLFNKL